MLCHEKMCLMNFVVVIPKEGLVGRAPSILLVWHRLQNIICEGGSIQYTILLSVESPYGPGDRYCEAGPGWPAVCLGCLSGHVWRIQWTDFDANFTTAYSYGLVVPTWVWKNWLPPCFLVMRVMCAINILINNLFKTVVIAMFSRMTPRKVQVTLWREQTVLSTTSHSNYK